MSHSASGPRSVFRAFVGSETVIVRFIGDENNTVNVEQSMRNLEHFFF
jgi:hypothetical protein